MVYMPENKDIEKYREALLNKKIVSVEFTENGDEGLIITAEDDSFIDIAFSRCEGAIYCNTKNFLMADGKITLKE